MGFTAANGLGAFKYDDVAGWGFVSNCWFLANAWVLVR
jgi:hypothetical protein